MGNINFDQASVGTVSSSEPALSVTNNNETGSAIVGIAQNPNAGVLPVDWWPNAGVVGLSNGEWGNSGFGFGVLGIATSDIGVSGITSGEDAVAISGIALSGGTGGGFSSDTGTAGSFQTDSGTAGSFQTDSGTAGYFQSNSGFAIQAISNAQDFDTINASSVSTEHAAVAAYNGSGGPAIFALTDSGTAGYFWSNNGIAFQATGQHIVNGNAQVNGNHYVTGDAQVAGDVVLVNAISGDVAEDFDLENHGVDVEPGMVLIIGANGKLRPCDQSYDSRVAGVVSGAGELRPAIVLQRIPTAVARSPIALIGKTYCKVDSSFGRIAPGDLLTTSPTRGHAMKVVDRSKALGAVLGKALKEHHEGCGMIPILISPR